jgi:L-methionine (R)-S-oxide reductase
LPAPKSGTVPTDYDLLERQVRGLLEDERDPIANAANFAAFVYAEIPAINWAGFYFPAQDGLVLGPFGGKPACTRLPKGQGICNRAFDEKRTVVVDDVSTAADHIYCDSASRSELVVPLLVNGDARGVFDLDSPELARFTPADQAGIERLVAAFLDSTPM